MTKEYEKKAEEMKKILSVKDNAKEERNIKVTNPYSGQSEMLTMSEAIHYFMIKKFEEERRTRFYLTCLHLMKKFL